jgi:hypothetical protein
MARNRAMAGPGSKKMGGAGIKSGRPPTPMAGSGLGAGPGSPAAKMGAPPMAPKVANARPPMGARSMGAGAPPPMPGGSGGPPPAGPPPTPPGGMGGSGGFAKGGGASKIPDPPPTPPARELPTGDNTTDYERINRIMDGSGAPVGSVKSSGYARGGSVGIGGDTKPRHQSKSHK